MSPSPETDAPAAAPPRTGGRAELVQHLTTGLRLARLYAGRNKAVIEAGAGLEAALREFLVRHGKAVILVEKGLVFVNARPLGATRAELTRGEELEDTLELVGVGGVFLSGVWSGEAVRLLLDAFSTASRAKEAALRDLKAAVEAIPAPAIIRLFSPEQARLFARDEEEGHLPPRALAVHYFARLVALAEAAYRACVQTGNPDLYSRNVRDTLAKVVAHLDDRVFVHQLELLTALSPETAADALALHAGCVTVYSLLMGRLLGLTAGELSDLGYAALFHDLGRAGGKTRGEPDPDHVPRGVQRCLRGRANAANHARIVVVREHHLAGPRSGTAGSTAALPAHPYARIVHLADVFDRLQNGTPGNPGLGPERALAAIRMRAGEGEPAFRLLEDALGPRPRGSVVVRGAGEALVVESGTRRGRRPCVLELSKGEAGALVEVAPDELAPPGEAAPILPWRDRLLGVLPGKVHLRPESGADVAQLKAGDAGDTAGDDRTPLEVPRATKSLERVQDGAGRAFLVGKKLGQGGQGLVHEVAVEGAPLVDAAGAPVARAVLKLALPGHAEALERERRVYSYGHEGIVRLLASGEVHPGEPWLVLERLEPLPPERLGIPRVDPGLALDIFVDLLETQRRIHFRREHPLVLCDVKPQNLMLRLPPGASAGTPSEYLALLRAGSYEPVFMDLGVSRERGELDARGGRLDELLGTPAYLPPESCPIVLDDRVLFGVYGPKTDVYGLALALYVLITGDPPYARSGLAGKRGQDHLKAVLDLKREQVDPIDRARLGELLGRETAAAFLEVLGPGLDPDPERRPALQTLFRLARDAFAVVRRESGWGVRYRQTRLPTAPPSFYGID